MIIHNIPKIGNDGNYKGECANMNFLRVQTDNHLKWKNRCNQMILNYVEHVMKLGLCFILAT